MNPGMLSSDKKFSCFWFRRDLRLDDNTALYHALRSGNPVLCMFVFDTNILDRLEDTRDARVVFIHDQLNRLQETLTAAGSSLLTFHGTPQAAWKFWFSQYPIAHVYCNHDYEPYARDRDTAIAALAAANGAGFSSFKDQVIFERDEVVKDDGAPYTVFTPYKNKYLKLFQKKDLASRATQKFMSALATHPTLAIPPLKKLGFEKIHVKFPAPVPDRNVIRHYGATRDFPAVNGTSRMSLHLRFGTVSVRALMQQALDLKSEAYVNELIWRDFYQMILWQFPHVAHAAFKPAYDQIPWRNNESEFSRWCAGTTGFPLVDAGMRELEATGFMHNRVRMVTASFLVKHLLIDWRWGEAWFARKLLDFDLAANNGGWQWAAGSGCDAAPYFRIFNPSEQLKRFDKNLEYVKKWVPEFDTLQYPQPMVDHPMARKRCLDVYQKALRPA